MSRAETTWPEAAARLARAVERRDRIGAWVGPLGPAVGPAAVLALGVKAFGADGVTTWLPLAAGAFVALVLGWRRSRGVGTVRPSDAAWALDRVAEAGGRGLAAATVPGPVGAEAHWGPGRRAPPRVRLLSPRGLALSLCGGLLALVALLVPPVGAAAGPAVPGAAAGAGGGPAPGAPGGDLAGRAAEAAHKAATAAAVRDALGLGPHAAEDPARLADRLVDERIRSAAAAAARGNEILERLASAGPDAAHDLAEALAEGRRAGDEAEAVRREEARRRVASPALPVPPARRPLLERYFGTGATPDGGTK